MWNLTHIISPTSFQNSSYIFGGDLNKKKSGLKVTNNIYHLKNIGEFSEKIEVTNKIFGHPPFGRAPNTKIIKFSTKKAWAKYPRTQKNSGKNQLHPKIKHPNIEKTIFTDTLNFDDKNYNDAFEKHKEANKERFKLLKQKQAEEIAILLKSDTLRHEPYQRIARLLHYRFDQKFWNEDNQEKKNTIIEGYKSLLGNKEYKISNDKALANIMNSVIDIIINTPYTEQIPPPTIPQSRARDLNGFSQR